MDWKALILVAAGATLGVLGVNFYFNGFDLTLTLVVGAAAFLGAILFAYISTLGRRS